MPVKNAFNKLKAVMRNIAHFFYCKWRIKVPLYLNQPATAQLHFCLSELGFEQFGIADYRGHLPYNGFIGTKEINQRKSNHDGQADQKAAYKKKYLGAGKQFF